MVSSTIRSLVLSVERGDRSPQWGDSTFCIVLDLFPCAWKQRKPVGARGACSPGLLPKSLLQAEKVPVGEHACLGPGSAETAAQGVDASVQPGHRPKGL